VYTDTSGKEGWHGLRLFYTIVKKGGKTQKAKELEEKFKQRFDEIRKGGKAGDDHEIRVKTVRFSLTHYTYSFYGETFTFNTIALFSLTFVIGIIGGTYGIGGGAIIAPFLVAVFGLPVYTIAGAALLGTLLTSVVGVIFYTVIAAYYAHTGLEIAPDWALGALFGAGGFAGMYCGARLQKHMSAKIIKTILAIIITLLAGKYIINFLL
jgi:uncharacterized membrane protein YfcA